MKAIEFPGVNVRIAEDQTEYQTLPALAGKIPMDVCPDCNGQAEGCQTCEGDGFLTCCDGITCCFKLTPEELAEIARTGIIWHTVLTFGQPLQPQSMSLQRPAWVPES
jgi:hypothetical protein